jgi:hypothetical protein
MRHLAVFLMLLIVALALPVIADDTSPGDSVSAFEVSEHRITVAVTAETIGALDVTLSETLVTPDRNDSARDHYQMTLNVQTDRKAKAPAFHRRCFS